jgi:hypothetical protein
MIITIVGERDPVQKSILATNLVALRARTGCDTVLIDAHPHKHSFRWGIRRSHATEYMWNLKKRWGAGCLPQNAQKFSPRWPLSDTAVVAVIG